MELRDYQQAAVDSILHYWASGGEHGLIVLPTGSGKSLVGAALIKILRELYGARVLVATHVSELVSQNAKALLSIWPEAPFGIYHAGLRKRDGHAPIVFAGIHSIYKRPAETVGPRDVLIIDEAHLLSHKDDGMYRHLIKYLELSTPGMRVGGLTATPYRMSTGLLHEDYGKHKALFSDIVYEEPIKRLLERGYLCPIVPYVSPQRIDTSSVPKTAGDLNKKKLQEVSNVHEINLRVVEETINAGQDRSAWLVFASGVEHAQNLTSIFRERDIPTACITEKTSERERQSAFEGARNGTIKCLVGMNTMTTGLDVPNVDLIACVRRTLSIGLWVQMLGRGTRLSPETGKTNCRLLDFTDNSTELGPIDEIDGSKAPALIKGEAPQRACPECHFVHHASIRNCPQCNHEYPAPEIKYYATSRAKSVISTQSEPVWHNVDSVRFVRHVSRRTGSLSLRVEYICGMRVFKEWVPFESARGAGMAKHWWILNSRYGRDIEAPHKVTEALGRTDELRPPGRIQVLDVGGAHEITARDYSITPGRAVLVEKPILKLERMNEQ